MPAKNDHTAFVTGGTGFVGSHLVEKLLAEGFGDVRCLVRTDPKYLKDLPVSLIRGTTSDMEALRTGARGADYIFHVAAITRAREWSDFKVANIDGTRNLLDAVREVNPGCRKILITSSLAAVGRCDLDVATEDVPMRPITRYGESKAAMEREIRPYSQDLPIVVVRPPAVYGPRERDIFTFFQSVARGLCPIVGTGTVPAVSLVHVKDLVEGMLQASMSEVSAGNTYFLGSPRHYSWNEIRDAATASLNRRVLTLRIPPGLLGTIGAVAEWVGKLRGGYPPLNREKASEIRYACTMCDHSRASADFDYAPDMDLKPGISETIQWYRAEGWL